MVRLHDFSRAAAALEGRNAVEPQDLRAMGYGIYVVGDDSDDHLLWDELCDSYLANLGKKRRLSLEYYGTIASRIGDVQAGRANLSTAQVKLGNQAVMLAELATTAVVDRVLGRGDQPALKKAQDSLRNEIMALAHPVHTNFALKG